MNAEGEEGRVIDFTYVIYFEIRQLMLNRLHIFLADRPKRQV
jgi:hypothetical protein